MCNLIYESIESINLDSVVRIEYLMTLQHALFEYHDHTLHAVPMSQVCATEYEWFLANRGY